MKMNLILFPQSGQNFSSGSGKEFRGDVREGRDPPSIISLITPPTGSMSLRVFAPSIPFSFPGPYLQGLFQPVCNGCLEIGFGESVGAPFLLFPVLGFQPVRPVVELLFYVDGLVPGISLDPRLEPAEIRFPHIELGVGPDDFEEGLGERGGGIFSMHACTGHIYTVFIYVFNCL